MFTRDVKIVSIDSNECTKEVWKYQVEPNKIRVMISMLESFKKSRENLILMHMVEMRIKL